MMTVKQVSDLTGISVRTLQYYDKIGLMRPTKLTDAGYRLYDDTALERLQQILLFRELEFPLKEIKVILDSPNFDSKKALSQQIKLLELKKQHLENLIHFARGIKMIGVRAVDFSAFDRAKMDEYTKKPVNSGAILTYTRNFLKKRKTVLRRKTNCLRRDL